MRIGVVYSLLGRNVNIDQPHRHFRFIEVLDPKELKRSRESWPLVSGWLEIAERMSPGTPKALLEGDYLAELPEGTVFKEVSFKTEHAAVEPALTTWADRAKRRWAQITDDVFTVSDSRRLPLETVAFKKV